MSRICELQNVISELEIFHKEREVKDEATKQQQNKLIAFLQEKLDDTKKKKVRLLSYYKLSLDIIKRFMRIIGVFRCRIIIIY